MEEFQTKSAAIPSDDFKQSLQKLLPQLTHETDILISNLSICIAQSNQQALTELDLHEERSLQLLTKVATIVFKAPTNQIFHLFSDIQNTKTIELLLGKVFKEVSKIGDDFLNVTQNKYAQQEFENAQKIEKQIQGVVHQSLNFLQLIGDIIDYLVYDNYAKFETTIDNFSRSKSLLKVVLSILLESSKLQSLQKQLSILYLNKLEDDDEQDTKIILNFAKILFNLIISPNNTFRQQFIEEQGIYILKKILKKSLTDQDLEIYFYALGVIPPIVNTYPLQSKDFIDNGYCSLLSEHLKDFYTQADYLHICSPLLLAIRALVSRSTDIKNEFINDAKNLDILFEIASRSYGSKSLKNIYISAIILMSECGFEKIESTPVQKTLQEFQIELGNSEEPGADIKLKEYTWRLNEKVEKFKQYANDYKIHNEIIEVFRNNSFDDEILEKALKNLNSIWSKSLITKSYFITQYGNIDILLSCLKNLDENIMLNACKAFLTLLINEDGAQDIFIRHKGIVILKSCLQDYNIDIKKCSLQILKMLIEQRNETKLEILENNVIDYCINHIDRYPEDDIDIDILCLSLDIISQSVKKQPLIQQKILNKQGLNKIVVQFKLALDQIQKKPDQETKQQLELFDKLCLSIINIIYGNQKNQDMLRSELQMFQPIVLFLTRAIDNLGNHAIYNENTVATLLNLLINAIDTNKSNQEYFIKTFKSYDFLKALLTQQKSLRLSGLGSLLLSHLTWTNIDGQALFSTREILKILIFLIDFNQLINESEADSSVETLMEISFYSLLALINMSHENLICQQIVYKMGGLQVILKQLKSPSFEPKKTACFCLGNLIQNNSENQNELMNIEGVAVLVNLINDEEDDDLSNKAYQCLEYMGPFSVIELIKQMNLALSTRDKMWKSGNCIMLDVFLGRERHVYLKPLGDQDKIPLIREFGPQIEEDLIDQKSLDKLEKILPVLNGLVYLKKENRDALLKDTSMIKSLFEIFKYQLPIEIHENALYAILNIISESSKTLKEQLILEDNLKYLSLFINDLHKLEFSILRQAQKFLIADFEAAQMKEERTIEELQPTLFDIRIFEYYNSTNQMYHIQSSGEKVLVQGKLYDGQGLKKNEVLKHLQDLRALGYSIINSFLLGNGQLAQNFIETKNQNLPAILLKDLQILPSLFDSESFSDSLWDETLELFLNLVSIEQVYHQFKSRANLELDFLNELVNICKDLQSQSNQQVQQKYKTTIGKIQQVIAYANSLEL